MLKQIASLASRLVSQNKLSILIYHQVLDEHDPMRPYEPVKETFDWHMQLVSKYFNPISLTKAVGLLRENQLPGNSVCVTFDDGYLNNLTVAQPILEKYQIPATVYVSTQFSQGQNMWNDRLFYLFSDESRQDLNYFGESLKLHDWTQRRETAASCIRELKYLHPQERLDKINQLYTLNQQSEQSPLMMSPVQIKQLSDKGVSVGAHTVNHPILKTLSPSAQESEIATSKKQLENWLNKKIEHFAYPNGVPDKDFDEKTVDIVKQLGFLSAVTTKYGVSTPNTSPYRLNRFTPWDQQPAKFHMRMIANQINGLK